jgi:aminopeptidase N
MIAVGNFQVVKDDWRDSVEVSYYLEPEYAPYARMIFGNTPEMIEFFSRRLGVDFAWPKYSQIVVRDFVSGAMENTSAVVFYDRLHQDAREHLDESYENVISHELFHHWFGDLVTAESWANLALNESFATYGEYLWNEHKIR